MSQKPFMWNNNNPVEYSDPRGYDPLEDIQEGAGNAERAVLDPLQDVAQGVGAAAARIVGSAAAQGRALAGDVTQGIYRFTTREGLKYSGRSTQMPQRIARHITNGFLHAESFASVQVKQVQGDLSSIAKEEQNAIDAARQLFGPIANKRNAGQPKQQQSENRY